MSEDKKKFIYSLAFPVAFVALLWIIKILEVQNSWDLYKHGIYPLRFDKLYGIFTSPLIHGDFKHLMANSLPLIILGTGVFYFYKEIAYKVFSLSYLISNIWIWFGARHAYHIGASGLVYAMASFLFFSGVARRDMKLMAISLVVVFLYGSMVWGIFPMFPRISWESHLYGSIAGLILAFYYRNYGPKRKFYDWEFDDDDDDDEDGYWNINYEYDHDYGSQNH